MAGGNPLAPPGMGPMPGANPGGPVPQGGVSGALGGNRLIGPGSRGTGAQIEAPPPPDQPPSGQPSPVSPSKQGQPFADIHQGFTQAKAQYDQNMKAQGILDHLRVELDQLMEKGDVVRPEDVIEAAGRLVGHGIGASQLAQIMSDMPAQGGEGLAGWVRMHDLTITGAEQQLAQQNLVMQHRLGVASIKSLAASHMEQMQNEAKKTVGGQPQTGNGLSPVPMPTGSPTSMPMPAVGDSGEGAV